MNTQYDDLIGRLKNQLFSVQQANKSKADYYAGKTRLKNMDIALPPHMSRLGSVVGWPKIAVDSIADRIALSGLTHPDPEVADVVRRIADDNQFYNDFHYPVLDSLIHGVGFFSVHRGDPDLGEPEILVSAESPNQVTGIWNTRLKRMDAALKVIPDPEAPGQISGAAVFLPNETIYLGPDWQPQSVEQHNLGRVPIVRIANGVRSTSLWGASEITPDLRYYTEAGVRTLLGAEVSREFFSSPQRYILGGSQDLFTDEKGDPIPAWEAYIGKVLAIDGDEETGTLPQVGQFDASSPAPYAEVIEMLSRLAAGSVGIPPEYFGVTRQTTPASADAIRSAENRLIQKVQSKHPAIESAVKQVFALAFDLLGLGDVDPVTVHLTSPATPTPGATGDLVCKLIQTGVISPTSDLTYQMLGLSTDQAEQARADVAKANTSALLTRLAGLADDARQDPDVKEVNTRTTAPEAPEGGGDEK